MKAANFTSQNVSEAINQSKQKKEVKLNQACA